MESQAQMTAGDQGIAEDLAAAQEGAVPDGHYQAQVGTVQDGKVPRAGHGGQSRVRCRLTRRASEQRGRGLSRQERVEVQNVGGRAHSSRIAVGARCVIFRQSRVWTTSPFGDAHGHCGHGRNPV